MNKYDYTPVKIKRMEEKELRRLYSKYRQIANKRADRLRRAGFGEFENAQKKFKKLSKLSNKELQTAFADVNRYLRDERTKLKEFRRYTNEMIDTLQEHGYDFVNISNLKKFTDFMEWQKARQGANNRISTSPEAAEMFEQAEERGINIEFLKEEFDNFLENYRKTKRLYLRKSQQPKNNNSDSFEDSLKSSPFKKKKK